MLNIEDLIMLIEDAWNAQSLGIWFQRTSLNEETIYYIKEIRCDIRVIDDGDKVYFGK